MMNKPINSINVIERGEPSHAYARLLDMAVTPTPEQRQRSDTSHKCVDYMCETSTATYDSGNCSSSSNISDCSVNMESESHNNSVHCQHMLREKEHALFLALQDVRKLRSELERLNKSEQWYKQELRVQKSTRLEALERLYAQERNYIQENQRLQQECVRLYGICGELEQELEAQKAHAQMELAGGKLEQQHKTVDTTGSSAFEIEQQQALILDQQQLIIVLRKQKGVLLEDLKRLTCDKDVKMLELQQTLAGLELENTRITAKCKQLLIERKDLEHTLKAQQRNLEDENAENTKLQSVILDSRKVASAQEQLLALKEHEINDLQQQFKANLKDNINADEVHYLSMKYHSEINAKTLEITYLKTSLLQLQQELLSLSNLQAQNEQQEQQIEHLHFTMQAQQLELHNLQEIDATKAQQIAELQRNLAQFRCEQQAATAQLQSAQSARRSLEHELISLNEQYANMCALCERTRFELEMREIEERKLKYQAESDKKGTDLMRTKLRTYLEQTAQLNSKILELEAQLQSSITEKRGFEEQLRLVQEKFCVAQERLKEKEKEELITKKKLMTLTVMPEEAAAEHKVIKEKEESEEVGMDSQITLKLRLSRVITDHSVECLTELATKYPAEFQAEQQDSAENKARSDNFPFDSDVIGEGFNSILKDTSTNHSVGHRLEISQDHVINHLADFPMGHPFTVSAEQLGELPVNQRECGNSSAQHNQMVEVFSRVSLEDSMEEQVLPSDLKLPDAQVGMSEILKETEQLKTQLSEESYNLEIIQLQQALQERTQECQDLQDKFEAHKEDMEKLQHKLLQTDANLYKMERAQEKKSDFMQSEAEALDKLLQKQAQLNMELQVAPESDDEMQQKLQKERETVAELRSQLVEVKQQQEGELRAQLVEVKQQQEKELNAGKQWQKSITLDNEKEAATMLAYIKSNTKLYELLKQQASNGYSEELCLLDHSLEETTTVKTLNLSKQGITEIENYKETTKLGEILELIECTVKDSNGTFQKTVESKNILGLTEKPLEEGTQQHKLCSLQPIQEADVSTDQSSQATAQEEVIQLRAQLLALQEQIHISANADAEKSVQRISLINCLLAQQNGKVQQLNEARSDWEELSQVLCATQQFEINTCNELAAKRSELEELNVLFAEQNEELQELQVQTQQAECKRNRDVETYQEQVHMLEQQLNAVLEERKEQRDCMVELKARNERLQNDLDAVYACEVADNRKQLRQLQGQMEKLQRERERETVRIAEMEQECSTLKQSKREAIVSPELVLLCEGSVEVEEIDEDEKEIEKKKEKEEKDREVNMKWEQLRKEDKLVKKEAEEMERKDMQFEKKKTLLERKEEQVGKKEEMNENRKEKLLVNDNGMVVRKGEQMENNKEHDEGMQENNEEQLAGKNMLQEEQAHLDEEQEKEEKMKIKMNSGTDDRLRILTKVLESENKRKMKRYDLHIRTLLRNVRYLKEALQAAEQKTAILSGEQMKTAAELEDLQLTKMQLEELRLKFEQSQSTVKALEQSLDQERKKFETTDLGKSAIAQVESTHEVANLIDDYKKLIQQSALATCRPKTSSIMELIQRSSQCVPNLNKLESTVADLRADVQQFVAHHAQERVMQAFSMNALKVPSLLEELRTATEQF